LRGKQRQWEKSGETLENWRSYAFLKSEKFIIAASNTSAGERVFERGDKILEFHSATFMTTSKEKYAHYEQVHFFWTQCPVLHKTDNLSIVAYWLQLTFHA